HPLRGGGRDGHDGALRDPRPLADEQAQPPHRVHRGGADRGVGAGPADLAGSGGRARGASDAPRRGKPGEAVSLGRRLAAVAARAQRGLRAEGGLYVASTTSLAIAFLCLSTLLLLLANLSAVAAHWGHSGRLTVYLTDGARPDDIRQLELALEGLAEVRAVTSKSSSEARAEFLAQLEDARG